MGVITDFKFSLDKSLVLRLIDCYDDSEVYEDVCRVYDELARGIEGMLSPRAVFEFMERPEEYTMDEVKDCSHIVFCLMTLGDKITKAADNYFNGEFYLEGMLLNAMSDAILDGYSSQLYKIIAIEAEKREFGLSCKLSPGNADYHISNQRYIVNKLNGLEVLGVNVTEGFMLSPVKSVSFIFGADKSLDIPPSDHECSRCTSKTCKMRKEPYAERITISDVNITVLLGGKKINLRASKEKTILKTLFENGVKISSPCGGNGTCGKCRVQVLRGKTTKLDNSENLENALLKEGWVLACSTYPEEDCIITVAGDEENYNILASFENITGEINPICKAVSIKIDRTRLKEKSLTEYISEKLNKNYKFSLRALKNLGTVINSYGSTKDSVVLFEEELVNLIVHGNTILDACKTDSTKIYGIAIDIGTTTIALSLINLILGTNTKDQTLLNSQKQFGSDVISRIKICNEGQLNVINECIKKDIIQGIKDLCRSSEVKPEEVYHVAIAGNTTMMYLLLGLPSESLALYPFSTIITSMLQYDFNSIFGHELLDCQVTFLPGKSAYVGADIVSGMLHCGFDKLIKTSILIDIGTNGEMAIGNRSKILCLATAAGPAFEGANISCGIGSVRGAICSVKIKNGQVAYETIGNKDPIGICGSAVIDITAECMKNSIVDETGRFDEDLYKDDCIKLTDKIVFNQKDIRQVQLAKSAIRSGLEILLQEYDCSYEDIETVFLAGGFGNHMNIENAAVIGLIPEQLKRKVKAVANSSLGGAARYLIDERSKESLDYILEKTKYIDISSNKNFNDLFITNMMF